VKGKQNYCCHLYAFNRKSKATEHFQKRNKELYNNLKKYAFCTDRYKCCGSQYPTRHGLIKESIINKEIKKANMDINKVCRRFRNAKVLVISNISRAWHTRHGQH
jgi:hypothetical protein